MSLLLLYKRVVAAIFPTAAAPARGISVFLNPVAQWIHTATEECPVLLAEASEIITLPDEQMFVVEVRRRAAFTNH